jgi:asparagine synthase (glutamine-hydrolysing)
MIHNILQSKSWYKNDTVAVRGYCFDSGNNFCRGEALLKLFTAVKNEHDFLTLLQNVTGIFSVVIRKENKLVAASDKSRVFPLFYSADNKNITISDNPYNLLSGNPKIDREAEQEFLLSSFTLDEKTLIEGVFQIKPSCYLYFENGKITQKEYYSYCTTEKEIASSTRNDGSTLETDFEKVLERVFRRLIQSANGRQIVVPLSGGYDSRLIAAMLKRMGYENVVCYTVGRENNPEYLIAKEVARQLEYPYHFIFTGDKKFVENYTADETFQKYYKHSAALCSSFWMYEYFGVKYLVENDLVEKDAVFVPGHSGDFLAGSQTTRMDVFANDTKKEWIRKIAKYIFIFGKPTKKYREKISQLYDFLYDKTSFSLFDDFILKHRLPFLPNNSVRLYEFFNHEARLPFWDKEMLEFFRTLAPELKYNKIFYSGYLKENLFNLYHINFEKELQVAHKHNLLQPLKDFVKPYAPKFVFRLFSNYQDNTCMDDITAPLYADLKKAKIKLNTILVNEPYSKWYLMKIKEDLKSRI